MTIAVPIELVVVANPRAPTPSKFLGTQAMLEDEGIIPDNFKWPEGYDVKEWKDEKFKYLLRRQRPEGAKGPRRAFVDCDWWYLRWDPIGALHHIDRQILLKTQDLQDEIYARTAEGRAEWSKKWARYCKTIDDKKFQAFRALIPGLIKPPRRRRSNKSEQSQGGAA